MIVGIGTDIAEVDRIRLAVERYGERFTHRLYTEAERNYALRKANWAERFAARFAAKEAGMKAIGTGWRRGAAADRRSARGWLAPRQPGRGRAPPAPA